MGRAMEDMTSNAQLKPMFKSKGKPSNQSLFLFVTSIARTNLEVELIQRSGTLVTNTSEPPNPLLPKRDCIGKWRIFSSENVSTLILHFHLMFSVPLLHVLAVHARVLALWPAWMNLQQLCGLPTSPTNALASIEKEVPLLLRDPVALLLQFVLLLPLHVDQGI